MGLELVKVNNSGIIKFLKNISPPILWQYLYKNLVVGQVDKAYAYNPHYQQWLEPDFVSRYQAIKERTGCEDRNYNRAF